MRFWMSDLCKELYTVSGWVDATPIMDGDQVVGYEYSTDFLLDKLSAVDFTLTWEELRHRCIIQTPRLVEPVHGMTYKTALYTACIELVKRGKLTKGEL